MRRVGFGLVLALVVEYLVLPQLAGARKTLGLLGGAEPALLIIGLACEVSALVAYGALTTALLPVPRPRFGTIFRIELAALSVSHVVPGGGAAGGGVALDLLTDAGVARPDAAFALATQGLGSAVVLNAILWLSLVASIPLHGFNPLYATAAVLGVLVLGVFATLILLLTRGEVRAARIVRAIATHVPFLDPDAVPRVVHRVADRLRDLGGDRATLARAVGWACANWLLDAGALWLCLLAFGAHVSPDSLLVAYGLANVMAAIPVTPGGLGVMEAVLTAALVGFGSPRGVAILGVVTWRLFSFWLPIPVGAAAYLSLKLGTRRDREMIATELRRVAERATEEAERPPAWAARHGIRTPTTRRRRPT